MLGQPDARATPVLPGGTAAHDLQHAHARGRHAAALGRDLVPPVLLRRVDRHAWHGRGSGTRVPRRQALPSRGGAARACAPWGAAPVLASVAAVAISMSADISVTFDSATGCYAFLTVPALALWRRGATAR